MIDVLLCLDVRADNGSTLKCIEDLGCMKAEYGEISAIQNTVAILFYAEGMGGIVDDFKAMSVCDTLDAICIAWDAVAVHGQDSAGLWCDGCFDAPGV